MISFEFLNLQNYIYALNIKELSRFRDEFLNNIVVFKYELAFFLVFICYLVVFSKKSSKVQVLYQPTTSNKHIINRISHVISSFSPRIIFPGAVTQIFFAAKISPNLKIKYLEEIFMFDDSGSIKLELYPTNFYEMNNDTPIVFLLLGICGSTREKYPRVASKRSFSKGNRTVIINKRGFARTCLTSARFFHKDEIEDYDTVIMHFHKLYPNAQKYMIGTSQGALYTTKYLIKYGKTSPIKCAVSISNPFDNERNGELIANKYWDKKAINAICSLLKTVITFHKDNPHFGKLFKDTMGDDEC